MAVYRPDLALLDTQIQSIQAQTMTDWSCAIGLDGRDDMVASHIRRLISGDQRFTLLEFEDNVGVYRHFERLLRLVPGEARWIALADQDDYWYQNKLREILPNLQSSKIDCISVRARIVNKEAALSGYTNRQFEGLIPLLLLNQITGSFTVFRRNVLDAALPFPSGGPNAIHDHWLGICAAASGGVRILPSVLQDYVQHGANLVGETHVPGIWKTTKAVLSRKLLMATAIDNPWTWRVAVARAVIERQPNLAELRNIEAIAKGEASIVLLALLARSALKREVPLRVAVACAMGAIRWRRRGSDSSSACRV